MYRLEKLTIRKSTIIPRSKIRSAGEGMLVGASKTHKGAQTPKPKEVHMEANTFASCFKEN
jgi:hypothetical protein